MAVIWKKKEYLISDKLIKLLLCFACFVARAGFSIAPRGGSMAGIWEKKEYMSRVLPSTGLVNNVGTVSVCHGYSGDYEGGKPPYRDIAKRHYLKETLDYYLDILGLERFLISDITRRYKP